MADTSKVMLSIKGLSKRFDDLQVLKEIDFTLHQGELVTIIGASGCGKSTFLRTLNGLEKADCGLMSIDGEEYDMASLESNSVREIRTKMGMVFQGFNLFANLTAEQNIIMPQLLTKGVGRKQAKRIADGLIRRFGLQVCRDALPETLSGGQSQRTAIARALAVKPEILLYDEPTSALDPLFVKEIQNIMRDLKQDGIAQIVVTHEMRFAAEVSDYVYFFDNGTICEHGKACDLFKHPQSNELKNYLQHFNY